MKDFVVLGLVIVSFAILVTTHVTILVGLARRVPRANALLAFVVFPLAPFLAFKERMRVRGVVWILGAVLYIVARVLAR